MREEALRFYEANSREHTPYVEPKGYCYPVPTPPDVLFVREGGALVYDPNRPVTPEEEQAARDLMDQVHKDFYGDKA